MLTIQYNGGKEMPGENEAIIMKTMFDRERLREHEEQNLLHINNPEGVRLQLMLDPIKLYDDENAFYADEDGVIRIAFQSNEGWKAIPGRILVDPLNGNLYRILASRTYCGFDEDLNRTREGATYTSLMQAGMISVVEEEFLVEPHNMPLIYIPEKEQQNWGPFLDMLSRLGFFYHSIDLAMISNFNYSEEVWILVKMYDDAGCNFDKFIDAVNNERVGKLLSQEFHTIPLNYTEVVPKGRELKREAPALGRNLKSIAEAIATNRGHSEEPDPSDNR